MASLFEIKDLLKVLGMFVKNDIKKIEIDGENGNLILLGIKDNNGILKLTISPKEITNTNIKRLDVKKVFNDVHKQKIGLGFLKRLLLQ